VQTVTYLACRMSNRAAAARPFRDTRRQEEPVSDGGVGKRGSRRSGRTCPLVLSILLACWCVSRLILCLLCGGF